MSDSPPISAQAAALGLGNLNRAGALEVDNLPSVSLKNEIHTIFDRNAFSRATDEIYEELKPVLQLASLFITHPACIDWWVRLVLAEEVEDHVDGSIFLSTPTITRRMRARTARILRRVSTFIFFYLDGDFDRSYASTSFFRRNQVLAELLGESFVGDGNGDSGCTFAKIKLNGYFHQWLRDEVDECSPGLRLRTYFSMAVSLVHELAHAVHGLRFELASMEEFDRFFYNGSDPEAEVGLAWESDTFGSLPSTSASDDESEHWTPIPYYGLYSWRWRNRVDGKKAIAYAIPTKWVAQFFTAQFWELPVDELKRAMRIPRRGLGAIESEPGVWVPFMLDQVVRGYLDDADRGHEE